MKAILKTIAGYILFALYVYLVYQHPIAAAKIIIVALGWLIGFGVYYILTYKKRLKE